MIINEILVQSLIAKQFPEWKNLPIRAVSKQGWDNRSFRLGDELLVRCNRSLPPYRNRYKQEVAADNILIL